MNNSLEFDESRDPFPDWGTANFRNSRERIGTGKTCVPFLTFVNNLISRVRGHWVD
jgi:hypothetical protein